MKKTQIIHYEISEEKNMKINEAWVPYCETIEKFRNDTAFNKLKNVFKQTFLADLNEQDLFLDDIAYGQSCGFVGTHPKELLQIGEFVKNRDRNSLLKWLQSTNTEKQLYAVYGFSLLKKLKIKPNAQERKIIKAVLKKKGTVRFCYACVYSKREIRSAAKAFRF